MKLLAVAVAATVACAAPAFAQSGHSGHGTASGTANAQSPASEAYMKSMTVMDDAMKTAKMTGDPDKDFIIMMKPHHQAAVEMAKAYLKYGKDSMLTKMANDIIASQNDEIAAMDKWMKEKGGR
ncbi:MAG TPA: DUF305 domain-containing protein [Pseudolabrys sp.]|nr:DUF305 domain-containing protein [Pseudolabrys sp.]